MAFIAEIRERDADGVISDIYADIRYSSALPQVNLIYRHLATLPGVLAAVWASIGPWIRSADADAAVAGLLTVAPGGKFHKPVPPVAADEKAVIDLLNVYGRGNILNLLALSALKLRFTNPQPPVLPSPAQRTTTPQIPIIPALPRLDALPAATAKLVSDLAGLHEASLHGVTPSLYLHLAQWPTILLFVRNLSEPYVRQGGLAVDRASLILTAAAYGGTPAPLTLSEIPVAVRGQALAVIELFTTSVIPDMIAVGQLITSALVGGPVSIHQLEP